MKISERDRELFQDLTQFGTALDAAVARLANFQPKRLCIQNIGHAPESYIVSSPARGTEISIYLSIRNISISSVRVEAIELELPWYDSCMELLKKLTPWEMDQYGGYAFSPVDCGLPAGEVFNHRLPGDLLICPGQQISGFLLAKSPVSVPFEFWEHGSN